MKHNVLADMFSTIKNAEYVGKRDCMVPSSSLSASVLEMLKKHGYIESYESTGKNRYSKMRVILKKRINDCNVIIPYFDVRADEFDSFEKRFLPAYNIGILILTTSKGVMDHRQAKKEGIGGKLLGYVY